jgi:OmcA/MtrC family decaheme c-type cytochrome
MKSTLRALLLISLVTMLAPLAAADTARRRSAAPPAPTTPTAKSFGVGAKEYYLTDDGIAYIRPGLKIKVNSVTIGSDRKPVVDLTLTDNFDQPLDRLGKVTPGAISLSYVLAWYNPATRQYTSYITRTATAAAPSKQIGAKATQATGDSGGSPVDLATGNLRYTFGNALPSGFDQTKTHTLAIYATRNLTDQIGKNYFANVEYDFRPDGQKVTETWAKINLATSCNNCHDPLSAHGGSRQDPKLCATCHQPQTTDPDSGNTVDFKVMIHKIHNAPNLPSVQAGTPYQIIGFGQSVVDFSAITFPQDVRNCDNCHEGTVAASKPAQSDVWYTKPSAAACGSCHDDVDFKTGKNHPAGAQADDSACASCHKPDGDEWGASIKGAHLLPKDSTQLKGIKATIVDVKDVAVGKKPTVVFKLTNNDGSFIDGNKLNTFSPIQAGNTGSYSWFKRDNAINKATFDATAGTTSYTFADAIPAGSAGTWSFSVDIRRTVALKRADGGANISFSESLINPIKYVSLSATTPAGPRRTIVTLAQCDSCHAGLTLHGGQRNAIEECVICHNPTNTDVAQRPAAEGAPESISFQRMVHRIHSGEELTNDFTVFGNGGSKHNYNEVTFPGDRRNCAKCHAGTTYTLPVASTAANVTTPRDYFTTQGPGTAACLGCHDNKDAAAHAYLNTATFPGATTGAEACATCHGTGKDWDAAKVHAR